MNGWKVTAIIFIILFILETILFGTIIKLGVDEFNRESECSVNVCGASYYDAFYYDSYEQMCYCYWDGEVTHQEFLK